MINNAQLHLGPPRIPEVTPIGQPMHGFDGTRYQSVSANSTVYYVADGGYLRQIMDIAMLGNLVTNPTAWNTLPSPNTFDVSPYPLYPGTCLAQLSDSGAPQTLFLVEAAYNIVRPITSQGAMQAWAFLSYNSLPIQKVPWAVLSAIPMRFGI